MELPPTTTHSVRLPDWPLLTLIDRVNCGTKWMYNQYCNVCFSFYSFHDRSLTLEISTDILPLIPMEKWTWDYDLGWLWLASFKNCYSWKLKLDLFYPFLRAPAGRKLDLTPCFSVHLFFIFWVMAEWVVPQNTSPIYAAKCNRTVLICQSWKWEFQQKTRTKKRRKTK